MYIMYANALNYTPYTHVNLYMVWRVNPLECEGMYMFH